jgi:hypothetical protein
VCTFAYILLNKKQGGLSAQMKISRDIFRKKNVRGARIVDVLEEIDGLIEKSKKAMNTDNKDEAYYWHGILQFSITFKNKIENKFKIESR